MYFILFMQAFLAASAFAGTCVVIQAADVPQSAVIFELSRKVAAVSSVDAGTESRSVLRTQVPDAPAFLGWKTDKKFGSPVDAFSLEPAPFACEDESLYPTHPQMTLKEYHNGKFGTYDHFKLKAEDSACSIGAQRPNSKGIRSCFAGHILKYVVVSDTYTDACGNLYRGFVERTYFKREENMATLFSEGRTAFEGSQVGAYRDYDPGHTYPVPRSELLLLAEPFPGDREKIEENRAQADLAGYCRKDQVFLPKEQCRQGIDAILPP